MSNFKTQPFIMRLDNRDRHAEHLVITARCEYTPASGGYILFSASREGTLMGADIPEHLRGSSYSTPLGLTRSVNAHALRTDGEREDWLTPTILESLGTGALTGAAAEKAVWSMFYKYILSDTEFIERLDNEWLLELNAYAHA
jgi:hypothetical protein